MSSTGPASTKLNLFNDELDSASSNIGAVGASVGKAREAVEDVEAALGVFGRIEGKADEVADILDSLQTVASLLGKFSPLREPMRLLREVLEKVENGVVKVEKAARDIDTNQVIVDLKRNTDDIRIKLEGYEQDVQDARDGFDERRTPLQSAEESLDDLLPLETILGTGYVTDLGGVIDDILDPNGVVFDPDFDAEQDPDALEAARDGMLDYTVALNDIFTDVDGALMTFNGIVEDNPLREALAMEAKLCAIVEKLQGLKKPLEIIEKAVAPVEWALEASEKVIDAVVGPVLDPLMETLGIDKLTTAISNAISGLIPDLDELNPFGDFDASGNLLSLGGRLTDLASQINLPDLDLDAHLNLTGFFDNIDLTLDVGNFSLPGFQIGGDGDDVIVGGGSDDILSGGAGFDWLRGGLSTAGNFISGGVDVFVAGLGNDLITGNWSLSFGSDDTSAPDNDAVVFSGNLGEYLFEVTDTVVETINDVDFERAAEVIVTHGPTVAGQVSDGIDRIQGIKNYIFQDQELTREDLSNIDAVSDSDPDVIDGTADRDFILAGAVISKAITINGLANDDYILGGAKGDTINGGDGNDGIDGGSNESGARDIVDGGDGLDRLSFATAIRVEGERVDLGYAEGDRTTTPFASSVDLTSIEGVTGSRFTDALLGRDTQVAVGFGSYVERLSGGLGNDLLRGFGADDRLEGDEGDDILISDSGSNLLFGGRGDDLIALAAAAGVAQRVDGGDGIDRLSYAGGEMFGIAPRIASYFDKDIDGWMLASVDVLQWSDSALLPGDTGGYLEKVDTTAGQDAYIAPDKFLGDQSQMFGGALLFDVDAAFGLEGNSQAVTLVGGDDGNGTPLSLTANAPFPPPSQGGVGQLRPCPRCKWRLVDFRDNDCGERCANSRRSV